MALWRLCFRFLNTGRPMSRGTLQSAATQHPLLHAMNRGNGSHHSIQLPQSGLSGGRTVRMIPPSLHRGRRLIAGQQIWRHTLKRSMSKPNQPWKYANSPMIVVAKRKTASALSIDVEFSSRHGVQFSGSASSTTRLNVAWRASAAADC